MNWRVVSMLEKLVSALKMKPDATLEQAIELARVRMTAGDESWAAELDDETQEGLLKALDDLTNKTASADRIEKIRMGLTGAERAARDAVSSAYTQAERSVKREVEPNFTERDYKAALADVTKDYRKHLAKIDIPDRMHDKNGNMMGPAEKLMVFDAGKNEPVVAFQEFCDTAYALSLMTGKGSAPKPVDGTRFWQRNAGEFTNSLKAMYSTGALVGDDWVPTGWSSQIIERVRIQAKLPGMHPRFTMPTNPFTFPLESTDPVTYLQGEATADENAKYKTSTPGTANKTFTAAKIATRIMISEELEEDSVIAVLPQIIGQIAKGQAEAWDDILVNGQPTSHIDTGDVPAADDVRHSFDGYRYYAAAVTDAAVSLSTFSADNVVKIPAAMGKYGQNEADLMWVCSVKTHWSKLITLRDAQNNNVMLNFGAAANQGPFPSLFGIDVVRTGQLSDSLSDTGIYDGTTTDCGVLILVYKDAFLIGDRREMRSDRERDIDTGQWKLVTTSRFAINNVYSAASNPTVGIGYDFHW